MHHELSSVCKYQTQVRFHLFGGALINAVGASKPQINFPYASSRQQSMVVINVDAQHEVRRGKSFCNSSEVEVVLKVVKRLLKGGDVKEEDIAVISPYIY